MPLLQSFGLQPRAFKLAGTVEQTGGYNFLYREKKFQLVKSGAQLSSLKSGTLTTEWLDR